MRYKIAAIRDSKSRFAVSKPALFELQIKFGHETNCRYIWFLFIILYNISNIIIYERRCLEVPYVNIKITKEGNVTPEQKAKLISGATQLLVDVLGKNPASTVVVIDEVDTDNWGLGGLPVLEARKKNKM